MQPISNNVNRQFFSYKIFCHNGYRCLRIMLLLFEYFGRKLVIEAFEIVTNVRKIIDEQMNGQKF